MKTIIQKLYHALPIGEIPPYLLERLNRLEQEGILKREGDAFKLDSKYRIGKIDISPKGFGYLDELREGFSKDLMIEPFNLGSAHKGDIAVVKRLFSKRGAKAKVIEVLERESVVSIGLIKIVQGVKQVLEIRSALPLQLSEGARESLGNYQEDDLLKIENENGEILDYLGSLSDPKVDEKISLGLYNKKEFFDEEAEKFAKRFGLDVDRDRYPKRVDLTHLPFCTIDPPDAKDFDDAIYFDEESYTLFVAIADVSYYVKEDTVLDMEAKQRGFSIYFPHKSIPMLPRSLSENICSLKPDVDRLAFTIKIKLDRQRLIPIEEEIFESVIHSQRRFTYDEIDAFITGDMRAKREGDEKILSYLLPLQKILLKIKKQRLADGCDFRSSDVRMILDENQNLIRVREEPETPSHALIEDAMLLANQAAAKRYDIGIFRTHASPDPQKLETLCTELEKIGIEVERYEDPYRLIRAIQEQAEEKELAKEVDTLIIKTQQQALYTHEPLSGHFGLGFSLYTHFTSPIRRYSDLIVHRLLKAILRDDIVEQKKIIANAEVISMRVSELEREATKVEWDFKDRKYARWMQAHQDEPIPARIIDLSGSVPIAQTIGDIAGARVYLIGEGDVTLFDEVMLEIVEVDIATTKIIAKVVEICSKMNKT